MRSYCVWIAKILFRFAYYSNSFIHFSTRSCRFSALFSNKFFVTIFHYELNISRSTSDEFLEYCFHNHKRKQQNNKKKPEAKHEENIVNNNNELLILYFRRVPHLFVWKVKIFTHKMKMTNRRKEKLYKVSVIFFIFCLKKNCCEILWARSLFNGISRRTRLPN